MKENSLFCVISSLEEPVSDHSIVVAEGDQNHKHDDPDHERYHDVEDVIVKERSTFGSSACLTGALQLGTVAVL